jgi:hypothetical protein
MLLLVAQGCRRIAGVVQLLSNCELGWRCHTLFSSSALKIVTHAC